MPFCSPRCQLIDLQRWMNHEIGIPHASSDEDDPEEEIPSSIREWRFDEDEDANDE